MSNIATHGLRYGIKHLAAMTGLSRHVLRKWEQRYDLLSPQRAKNRYRVYTPEELQLVFFLKYQLNTGAAIGQLALQGREELIRQMNAGPIDVHPVLPEAQLQARELIQAARRSDRTAVDRTITLLIQQWGFDRALTGVFFPVLQTIGELWHQGRISVVGEQMVSQTIQRLLSQQRQSLPRASETDYPQALVACVPNDFHEIGAMSAVRFLRNGGWNVTYLGPDVSIDVVRVACRRRQAKLVLFSCIIELASADMNDLIDDIVRELLPLTTVVIGGRGADCYRDRLEQKGIRYIDDVGRMEELTPRSRTTMM
jgi:methanogenic corrinoid protein MtbC1